MFYEQPDGRGPTLKQHSQTVEKVRPLCTRGVQRLNVRDRVRFASSLAAALLDTVDPSVKTLMQ